MTDSQAANCLSEGAIELILSKQNETLKPIVQILGTKTMNSGRVRVVVWDTNSIAQHCVLLSEEVDDMMNTGKLEKFSVIRLDDYSVSTLPNKGDIPVLLVTSVVPIKSGMWDFLTRNNQTTINLSFGRLGNWVQIGEGRHF